MIVIIYPIAIVAVGLVGSYILYNILKRYAEKD